MRMRNWELYGGFSFILVLMYEDEEFNFGRSITSVGAVIGLSASKVNTQL